MPKKSPSKLRQYMRYTWKLNMGEQSAEEFRRSEDSQQKIDTSSLDDPRFKEFDGLLNRAFDSASMRDRSILDRERLFLRYYKINRDDIHSDLRNTGFFQGRNDFMIESIVVKRVRDIVNLELFKELERLISLIDFRFLESIVKKKELIDDPRRYFYVTQKYLLSNRRIRERYTGSFIALQQGFVKKYLEVADESTVFIDTAIFEPLTSRLSRNEIVNLARISILMISAVFLSRSEKLESGGKPGRDEIVAAYNRIKEKYPAFPDSILRIGLSAALTYRKHPNIPALSQYCAIIANRCERYVPPRHQDRAAKSPDESWFNIASRNNERHGFNPTLLGELTSISADNGW